LLNEELRVQYWHFVIKLNRTSTCQLEESLLIALDLDSLLEQDRENAEKHQ